MVAYHSKSARYAIPDTARIGRRRYPHLDEQPCIDQHNEAENSHQIRLMRHLYSKATHTFVVTSQPTFESAGALFVLGRLAESGKLQPRVSASGGLRLQLSRFPGGLSLVQRAWRPNDLSQTILTIFGNKTFRADFDMLMRDPVFQRAWVY